MNKEGYTVSLPQKALMLIKKTTLGLDLGLLNRIMRISIDRYLVSIVYNSVALLTH